MVRLIQFARVGSAALCWLLLISDVAYALDVEVYAGQPFGVGRVTATVASAGPAAPLEDERFTVASPDGRVLYPVIKEEPARRLLRRLLDIDAPRSVTIYFLFRGDQPFELETFAPTEQRIRVAPQTNPQAHQVLLDQWWQQYANRWKSLRATPQFPPVVENFLAANLSRRLGKTLPEPTGGFLAGLTPKKTVWDELFNSESHQLTLDQQLLAAPLAGAGQPMPLPAPLPWFNLPEPDADLKGVGIEPMALHVPVECFYLRFGNFTNYLWFRDLSKKWQGDLGNMLLRRGIDRASTQRLEQQLSLRENALAKILGPQVIADVAMIGLDPYMPQGAAVGILFQAKANPLLANDLMTQRRQALKNYPDAAESTVKIAERDVSLVATPGGEVRSYYVQDGDFHLVTTSERLVQRFLLAGQGEGSLGASAGFLGVRKQMPVSRDDAIFAYISPEFFKSLTSPAIWIESQRRARSAREVKLLELAQLEAKAEGVEATTVEQLIAAGLLPAGFGQRSDGSQLVVLDRTASDSLRGRPGLFRPAAEVEVTSVTAVEAAAYRDFAERFGQEIAQLPPIGVAIERRPTTGGETLVAEVWATPLSDVKLGRLPTTFGPPSGERLAPVVGNVVSAEAVLDSPLPFGANAGEPNHLFLGVRDFRTPLVVDNGSIGAGAAPAELVRMYVGAWPKPGLLTLFTGEALAQGEQPIPGAQSTWQAKRDDFLLISFKPDLVREVLPQLRMVPVEHPGQLWIDVADLTDKQLAAAVNAFGYMRARETSVAASRLMNTLANQLNVPRSECQAIAETLMDGKFVCPLGGKYELVDVTGGEPMWTSSAIRPQNRFMLTAAPDDFQLPLLTWFRGLRAEARLDRDALNAHVEIDMAASAMP
ncbi:hypothetical protein I41_29410 [Lacipirellula limnantheis]|uniref:Uncharacterized protein n=1 Tax=Lacipirellula limnantheis TaxID=2528024 RepID=A0A517TZE5_9BACT|nr:hypothetical protein I41_29410 [Lacipirellula limnantheis]